MERLIFPVTKKEAEKSGKTYSSGENKNALFPSQLRELRKEKGISQETLARDLGVSKSTIGLYETGDTLPDAKTLYNLAVYFNVSTDWLLGLSRAKTSDINIRGVYNMTGLSETSINRLMSTSERNKAVWTEVIDQLLLQPRILDAIHAYLFLDIDSFSTVEDDGELSGERYKHIALVDNEHRKWTDVRPDMMEGALQVKIQQELSALKQGIKKRRDADATEK